MALSSGSRLGVYEVTAQIGEGGMGQVYRATDTRLKRLVAIKILPPALAADADRLARFQREAEVLASLNHPNIAAIYGLEESGGMTALVMELVEGEDLSQRIARLRAPGASARQAGMALDEALPIARQIAEALEAAHEQGIVHRDLKPANIKVRADGTVKVLDFGLAKAVDRGSGIGDQGSGDAANSPTITTPAMTMRGMILGTAAYMSPEQAKGKAVDKRSDIWAFGAVLYELLTGRRVFDGDDTSEVLAAVLRQDIPWSALPASTPPRLRRLLERCLDRDARTRLRDIGEARVELARSEGGDNAQLSAGGAATQPPHSHARARFWMILGSAAIAGLAGVAAVLWMRLPVTAPGVVTKFAIVVPDGHDFRLGGVRLIALAPDGASLIYVADRQLYLRKMGDLSVAPVAGTEDTSPNEPVFSPDAQWVAFYSAQRRELVKVPVTGGSPVTLATIGAPFGMSWVGDRILLGQESPRGIVEVPAGGGPAKLLVGVDEGKQEFAHGPQLIAGGRAVLFTLRTATQPWDAAAIVVQELATGRRTELISGGTDARVLPTGHLVYFRGAALFALPFDEERLAATGGPVPLQPGIAQVNSRGHAAWSNSGTMAFVPTTVPRLTGVVRRLAWLTRDGQQQPVAAPEARVANYDSALFLSPDGTRAIAWVMDGDNTGRGDIWVWTAARGTLTRLTFTGSVRSAVWTPDSRRICYHARPANRELPGEVFCQAADGSRKPELLFTFKGLNVLSSMRPGGNHMVFTSGAADTGFRGSLMLATLGASVEVRTLLERTGSVSAVSPDGRWVAYHSDESGRSEVYVRPFPNVDEGRWQVSLEGGANPRWSPNGRELLFRGIEGAVRSFWTSAIQSGSSFVAGKPAQIPVPASAGASVAYDVAADGRLLVHLPVSGDAPDRLARAEIIVVQNWFDELKARLPATRRP